MEDTGNVGIGTTDPGSYKLNVVGALKSSGQVTFSNYTGNNAVLFATTGTGVLSSATTSTAGQCLLSGASVTYTPTWGSCGGSSSAWSGLGAPTANLSLGMSTYTTAFNWATGTSTSDLFSLTTDASANGTGALFNLQTGAGATVLPLRVRAGSTEALAVKADGNIGIGIMSPSTKLHLDGGR